VGSVWENLEDGVRAHVCICVSMCACVLMQVCAIFWPADLIRHAGQLGRWGGTGKP